MWALHAVHAAIMCCMSSPVTARPRVWWATSWVSVHWCVLRPGTRAHHPSRCALHPLPASRVSTAARMPRQALVLPLPQAPMLSVALALVVAGHLPLTSSFRTLTAMVIVPHLGSAMGPVHPTPDACMWAARQEWGRATSVG